MHDFLAYFTSVYAICHIKYHCLTITFQKLNTENKSQGFLHTKKERKKRLLKKMLTQIGRREQFDFKDNT